MNIDFFYRLNKLNSILINLNLLSNPTQKKNKDKKLQKQKKTVHTNIFLPFEYSVFVQAKNQKRNQISEMRRNYSTDATHDT